MPKYGESATITPKSLSTTPPPTISFTPKSPQDPNASYTATLESFFATADAMLDAYHARSTQMAGMLSMYVSTTDTKCYDFGSQVPVKILFQNQTDHPITVQSRFIMSMNQDSHGDIIPKFSTINGQQIVSEVDRLIIETEAEWTVPKDFIELRPHSSVEITKEFFFPTKTIQYGENRLQDFELLPEGNYLVEFEYHNGTVGPENTWSGYLNSNTIEVCMYRAE
jgi:hypothetical protein